ncbi:putative MFS transporter [Xylaria longipes]|nr:putative MFS transporter [Xylaria longipes]
MDQMLHVAVSSEEPRQSSIVSKTYHTWIPCIVGFLVCFASTTTVPAQLQLQKEFGVSETAALLPFTVFILGLGFGPLIGAPISENFGRRPVYQLSVPAFCLFILGSGLSVSFASLLICRFLAGAFGGSALVVGFGLLTDIWAPHQLPIALSVFNTVPFMGPSAGQLASAFLVERFGWRWTQWVTLMLGLLTWLTILPMSEVHLPAILRNRNNSRRTKVNFFTHRTVMQILSAIPFVRPLQMLVTEPIVGLFALYVAFNFAAVYCFSSIIPFAFKEVYHFTLTEQGLVFLSLIVGYLLACPAMIIPFYYQMRKHSSHQSSGGAPAAEANPLMPESLLWPAQLGSLAMPISFFWFGWSASPRTPWIVPAVGLGLFAWGNDLLYNSSQLYLLETYGSKYGASATAANNLLRYCLASTLPLFITQLYSDLGINWGASLLGFILVGFLPIPWVFKRYGSSLRSRSRYVDYLSEII